MIWDNLVNMVVLGTKFLKEMEQEVVKIKQNLKAAQDSVFSRYMDKFVLVFLDGIFIILRMRKSMNII